MPSASPYVLPGQAHVVVNGRLIVGIRESVGQPGYTMSLLLEDGVVGFSSLGKDPLLESQAMSNHVSFRLQHRGC